MYPPTVAREKHFTFGIARQIKCFVGETISNNLSVVEYTLVHTLMGYHYLKVHVSSLETQLNM